MQSKAGRRSFAWLAAALVAGASATGCHAIPLHGSLHTDTTANVTGGFAARVDVRMPAATDPGPMTPSVVRPSPAGSGAPRVALIDVDGLLLNQNQTGLYSSGENPVAAFREKLEAAAADPLVRAVVVRIHSPGGGVTAADIMAEDLRRFRLATGKPVVACLMDLATSGAYYLAVGADRIVAHPTAITGGVAAIVNHYNLRDASAQFNVTADAVKAGELADMGTVLGPLEGEPRRLMQEMADAFRDRFLGRVAQGRPTMTDADRVAIADGRVMAAPRALALHLIDRLGYVDDALAEAERLAGLTGVEVVLYQRPGQPARSPYAITPNTPLQADLIPFSIPGLDRSKLPTFLYLWQPDPTLTRLGGR